MKRFTMVACLVLGLLAVSAVSAVPATASTVSVEGALVPITHQNHGTLVFAAAPGEDNEVTVTKIGVANELVSLRIVDDGAPLTAIGPACSGGGVPGSAATCTIPAPRQPTPALEPGCSKCSPSFVPETGWSDSLSIALGDGNDSFDGTSFTGGFLNEYPALVSGGAGDDRIATGADPDVIEPGDGHDEVFGGAGEDRVVVGPAPDGPDLYDLGPSASDLVDYSARATPLVVQGDTGGAAGEEDRYAEAEILFGGSGGDTLEGGAMFHRILGSSGNDTVVGTEAADNLYGGEGDDVLRGMGGDDYLNGENGNDLLDGGAGADRMFETVLKPSSPPPSFGENTTLFEDDGPAGGDDVGTGGPGEDYAQLGSGNDRFAGGEGNDKAYGEGGDDLLAGDGGDDEIGGEAGSDHLEGGSGNDQVLAGRLSETPFPFGSRAMDSASDSVDCGEGDDTTNANKWDAVVSCEHWQRTPVVNRGKLRRLPSGAAILSLFLQGSGRLTIDGPGIRPVSLTIALTSASVGGETRKVQIRPRGNAARRLHRRGHATVALHFRFAPTVGIPRSETVKAKLIRKPHHGGHHHHG